MARLPFAANYYEILGLTPSTDPLKDAAKIEGKITALEARSTNSKTGSAGDETALVIGKSLLKQMRSDLKEEDASVWYEHQKEWKALSSTRSSGLGSKLANVLSVLNSSEISKSTKDQIAREFGGEALVDGALKKASITVFEGSGPDKVSGEVKGNLKRALAALLKLAPLLRLEKADDIWALLSSVSRVSVTRKSNEAKLKEAGEALGELNNSSQVTKEAKAAYQLLRNGTDNLINGHDPKNPDAALNLFDQLWRMEQKAGLLALLTAFQSLERVTSEQFERANAICAKAAGLSQDKGRELLRAVFEQRRINLPKFRSAPLVPLRSCPHCGSLMGAADRKCSTCGRSPTAPCGNCGKTMDLVAEKCPSCGVSVEQASRGKAHLKNVEIYLANQDITAAEAEILKAQNLLPDHNLADRAKELSKLRLDRKKRLEKLQALVLARQYEAAATFIQSNDTGKQTKEWSALKLQTAKARADAQTKVDEAKRSFAGDNFSTAAKAAAQAIAIVADNKAAQDILDSIPPDAPKRLEASIANEAIRLTWQSPNPADDALQFAVFRKIKGQTGDLERIAVVETTRFVDKTAPDGVDIEYAVFARRKKSQSPTEAKSKTLRLHKPIRNLAIDPVLGAVALRWSLPAGADFAEVRRHLKTDPPKSLLDLEPVARSTRAWQDKSDLNTAEYTYILSSCYGSRDAPKRGAPVRKNVTPQRAPELIGAFRKTSEDVLTWSTQPGRGDIEEIWCFGIDETLPKPDALMAINDVPARKEVVPIKMARAGTDRPGVATSKLPQGSFKVALARRQGTLVRLSAGLLNEHVQPVKNLRAQQNGKHLEVYWDWPEGVKKVALILTSYADGRRAAPPVTKIEVVPRKPSSQGKWKIVVNHRADIDVSVAGISSQGSKGPNRMVNVMFEAINEIKARVVEQKRSILSGKTKELHLVSAYTARWPVIDVQFAETDSNGTTLELQEVGQLRDDRTYKTSDTLVLPDALKQKTGVLHLSFTKNTLSHGFVLKTKSVKLGPSR